MDIEKKSFTITVPLDAATAARLHRLSVICEDEPEMLAASLLREILEDDAQAHGETTAIH